MNLESTLPYTSVTYMQLVVALAVLVVGLIVARVILGLFKRSMKKTKLSDVLIEFLARFMSALLYVLVILLVLAALGVTISSILVSLSAMVGLILGFGMSDTVNNIASGTWIAALGPIDIGEVVNINGKTGKVSAVGIMATELLTPDNVLVTIPNAQVWGTSIENYTRMPVRRADVAVGIAYGSSVDTAVKVAMEHHAGSPARARRPRAGGGADRTCGLVGQPGSSGPGRTRTTTGRSRATSRRQFSKACRRRGSRFPSRRWTST